VCPWVKDAGGPAAVELARRHAEFAASGGLREEVEARGLAEIKALH